MCVCVCVCARARACVCTPESPKRAAEAHNITDPPHKSTVAIRRPAALMLIIVSVCKCDESGIPAALSPPPRPPERDTPPSHICTHVRWIIVSISTHLKVYLRLLRFISGS